MYPDPALVEARAVLRVTTVTWDFPLFFFIPFSPSILKLSRILFVNLLSKSRSNTHRRISVPHPANPSRYENLCLLAPRLHFCSYPAFRQIYRFRKFREYMVSKSQPNNKKGVNIILWLPNNLKVSHVVVWQHA